jgi:hypothetical protein
MKKKKKQLRSWILKEPNGKGGIRCDPGVKETSGGSKTADMQSWFICH